MVMLRTVRKSSVEVVGDRITELNVKLVKQLLFLGVSAGHGDDGHAEKVDEGVRGREGGGTSNLRSTGTGDQYIGPAVVKQDARTGPRVPICDHCRRWTGRVANPLHPFPRSFQIDMLYIYP